MKTNVGGNDKILRLGVAIVLIILFYKSILKGTLGLIGLIIAFLLTLSSLIGFSFLYSIFKIDTSRKKEKENQKNKSKKK